MHGLRKIGTAFSKMTQETNARGLYPQTGENMLFWKQTVTTQNIPKILSLCVLLQLFSLQPFQKYFDRTQVAKLLINEHFSQNPLESAQFRLRYGDN